MKKFFILFAATCIASAAWAQVTADADPGEITFDGQTVATSYHFSSVDKVYKYLDEREKRTQTEADRLAEHLFEPLEIISGFNRDIIAEDTVKLDMLNNDGTPKGGQQLVTIAGKKRNGDHLVQSYYVQDAQIANIKSAENPTGTNTIFNAQYISYSYATENVLKLVQNTTTGNRNTRAGFPEPNAEGIRRVECIADGPNDAYVGLHWHLAPYDNLNALCLRKGIAGSSGGTERTGFFEFKNVGCYQKLYFLVAATGSTGKNRILYTTVTYSDGTTDHHSFTFDDHANIIKKITGKVNDEDKTVYDTTAYREKAACHSNFGTYSVSENSGVICLTDKDGNQKSYKIGHTQSLSYAIVCEMDVETHKLIDRIDFTTQDPEGKKHTDDGIGLVIFAVTGKVADIAAPDAENAKVSEITSTSFEACWDAIAEAASYRLDVATDIDFHHIIAAYNNKEITGTTCQEVADLVANNEYYWRVRAVDSKGGQSASSAPRRVRTESSEGPKETNDDDHNLRTNDITPLLNTTTNLIINRKLYKDGYYNTLCLPFDQSAADLAVETNPLHGFTIYEFEEATKTGEAQLDIRVTETDHIKAGVPYLLEWPTRTNEVLTSLEFKGVTITTDEGRTIGEPDEVQFVGNISTTGENGMENGNRNHLFIGANNELFWPNTSNGLKGFRAHFEVPVSGPSYVPRNSPARIVVQSNVATGVESTSTNSAGAKKQLENGQLFIIRDNIRYNVMGLQLR